MISSKTFLLSFFFFPFCSGPIVWLSILFNQIKSKRNEFNDKEGRLRRNIRYAKFHNEFITGGAVIRTCGIHQIHVGRIAMTDGIRSESTALINLMGCSVEEKKNSFEIHQQMIMTLHLIGHLIGLYII